MILTTLILWRSSFMTQQQRPRLVFHKSITYGADVPMRAELTMTWRRHGITHATQAHAILGSRGCYRMEYIAPVEAKGRIVYSDGKTQWQCEPRRNLLATTNLLPETAQNERDTEDLIVQNYRLVLVSEEETIAGRPVFLLELLPRHDGKSSQKRWIDKQTFRTLRIETHYPDGILARMVAYTAVTLPAKVVASDFVPQPSLTLQRVTTPLTSNILPMYKAMVKTTDNAKDKDGNRPDPVPVRSLGLRPEGALGFLLTQVASSSVEHSQTAHLLYSDGIETISVFVQNGDSPALANAPGWHLISIQHHKAFENLDGHLDAVLWTQDGHRYTAVSYLGPKALQQFVGSQLQNE